MKCSRTRLEFKEINQKRLEKELYNAVAPDWNLKISIYDCVFCVVRNAVAPDWNLKLKYAACLKIAVSMQSHQIGI